MVYNDNRNGDEPFDRRQELPGGQRSESGCALLSDEAVRCANDILPRSFPLGVCIVNHKLARYFISNEKYAKGCGITAAFFIIFFEKGVDKLREIMYNIDVRETLTVWRHVKLYYTSGR